MAKFILLTLANIIFGYAALVILARAAGIFLPVFHQWLALMIGFAGPLPLLVTGLWSAAALWQARQVSNFRTTDNPDVSQALARGDHEPARMSAVGPAWPELVARGLVWTALSALPVWLGWPLPLLWPAMLYGLWAVLRWSL
ncbi:hypothetical protein [Pseudoponticoccus marisrubri]|uniref:Uncharacterized protein n=1 Tax=Pseudoponticoccus marisrubri TaxID=1685382 RepID=A0A0W7WNU2_9RHOB|nr:hypothetical protein [Pseudoponticoccus marisrubri]KUF12277.1 hypothetical protein AVJ23_00640 [Pseudoponticoccus marisrubri]